MRILSIILTLAFISCNHSQQRPNVVTASKDTALIMDTTIVEDASLKVRDTSIISSDSAKVNGELYTAFYRSDDSLFIKDSRNKIVTRVSGLGERFEFQDFNGDGFKDLKVNYMGNGPSFFDILLYDRNTMSFILVMNLSKFPIPKKIRGTKLYYSYHPIGCADLDWQSDLFYIENYTIIRIGTIAGYGCEDDLHEKSVFISKVRGNTEFALEKFPIGIVNKYREVKWGFIADYWKKNYKQFL